MCLQSPGQVGRVTKVRANGGVRVAVNGSRWIFNPKCLSPAPGETPLEETTGLLNICTFSIVVYFDADND